MASRAVRPSCVSRARVRAYLGATLLVAACSAGAAPSHEGPLDSATGYGRSGLEELQLSGCALTELERALQENAAEIAQAQAASEALPSLDRIDGSQPQLEAKANLHVTQASQATTRNDTPIPGGPARPDLIAKVEDGQAFFWRPDLGRRYYLVVPSEMPSSYFYALVLAASALESAQADDCIVDVFTVIEQDEYAALHPVLRAQSSAIEVGYSTTACLNQAAGCSNSPRVEELTLADGQVQARMRLGSYIGLETDYDTSRDPDEEPDLTPARARNVLLHELTHILGFEHPRYSELEPEVDTRTLRVPQSAQGTVPSFMFTTGSALYSATPTPEDRRVLARVYGADCAYSAEYRRLGEVCSREAENRCLAHGGSCEVARTVDDERRERCRWHNLREAAVCARYSAGVWETSNEGVPSTVFPGEDGACLASELQACVPDSFVRSALDFAGRCCKLFAEEGQGLLFEAFSDADATYYFCSHQRGLGKPADVWEFVDTAERADFSTLDAASGTPVSGWAVTAGELVQELELPSNLAMSRARTRSGCVMTRVTTDSAGESGIVFNYRSAGNYYVFDVLPNVHRRIRQVIDGVSTSLSVQPWAGPASWASSIRLSVCYGDGIHTFIDDRRSSRVSVDQRVAIIGSGGRIGLWNEHNPTARHDYLRVYSLVEGYALLRP